jgi:hypothetical protein
MNPCSSPGTGFATSETLPVMVTVSRPATVVALLIIALMIAAALQLSWQWRSTHRRHQMIRILNEAKSSYARGQAGLRTMAEVLARLPKTPKNLSRQGVGLLDAYADTATSFKHLMHDLRSMSRDRALRHLNREAHRLRDYETTFHDFQKEVLRMVTARAAAGILPPPIPVRRYRAAFVILQHELQQELWPLMNEVLAAGVQLRMLDSRDHWHGVPVKFKSGSQAVFSRRWLERAVALQMIIRQPGHAPHVFEFSVEHEQPPKAGTVAFSGHLAGPESKQIGDTSHQSV